MFWIINYSKNLEIDYIIKRRSKHKINQKVFNQLLVELTLDEEQILKENYGKKPKFFGCGSNDPFDKKINRIQNLRFNIDDPVMLGKDTMVEWKEDILIITLIKNQKK